MRKFRSVTGALATLVLLGGVAAGCADDPQSAVPAPAGQQTARQPAADKKPAGGAHAYCDEVVKNRKAFENFGSSGQLSAAEKVALKQEIQRLADVAPAEVKADVQTFATGWMRLLDAKVGENPAVDAEKMVAAIQHFNAWVGKNCAGRGIKIEGPGGR